MRVNVVSRQGRVGLLPVACCLFNMHPDLFTIPGIGLQVKTYGFFLTVGFLSAVWLAMRRAQRVGADPDRILDFSFIALFFGVGGARIFYVIHYWKTDFAHRPNSFLAIIDIRQGGLEFLGGLLGAMLATLIYLKWKRLSIRMYLDIMAPGAMWGLAFGRLGCFFNGCCFGGLCAAASPDVPKYPWAVQFPYGSNAHMHQWDDRQVTVPAELVVTRGLASYLLPATTLATPIERVQGARLEVERLEDALAKAAESKADEKTIKTLAVQLAGAKEMDKANRKALNLDDLAGNMKFPSRINPQRSISQSELQQLASECQSLPIHPTQLYASMNGFILSGLLSAVFYVRRRHGVVIGLLIVLYPISRVLEELIRIDNPHDAFGLTISQFISLGMFLFGVAYLYVLYTKLPERSPALANEKPMQIEK